MARKPKKYHYIYKTTCQVTNRFYVGIHSTDNLDDGYLGSGKILGYSRRKYGDENHVRVILEFCSSRDELKRREKEIVNEELLSDPFNINLRYGGEGGCIPGMPSYPSFTAINCIAGAKAQQKSLKAAQTAKNRCAKDENYALKYKQDRIKWRKSSKAFLGKKHSQQTKKKMSASQAGKQKGAKNSQYGTAWVTNGTTPIKIPVALIEEYLSKGYFRGRKHNHV